MKKILLTTLATITLFAAPSIAFAGTSKDAHATTTHVATHAAKKKTTAASKVKPGKVSSKKKVTVSKKSTTSKKTTVHKKAVSKTTKAKSLNSKASKKK
ncbi:hypothetical protein URH17368_1250 [Alicyclobacillus hesperidum URH17-3-68]|uniref:Acid shock protein n=1 Tax=Alicyclobacillus hesperidum TaxID=89784 RepID=A0A1H2XZP9_9BACL|nr:hypothetical protein [Alicyclobacillus hesperidum]EJY56080.1 hypothetical protein URH17368_1250 [Alicyclobacillus hesperidum URH17-3-68]GLV14444.1 hypothetical protein Heshes_21280 [Alicyclobacillus hesperidum]SDW98280.1 hypothetical protein SAMN04489725_1264 [Alicyclobacillus hesperidum]